VKNTAASRNRGVWSSLAAANEAVRLGFPCTQTADSTCQEQYNLLGWQTDGLNVWVMFKVVIVMPVTGLYAFVMTRQLQKYAIEEPSARATVTAARA